MIRQDQINGMKPWISSQPERHSWINRRIAIWVNAVTDKRMHFEKSFALKSFFSWVFIFMRSECIGYMSTLEYEYFIIVSHSFLFLNKCDAFKG